jgi:hypothetical protein
MSGIVARHEAKRKPWRTPAGNGILLRMDDDDEDEDEESESEAEPSVEGGSTAAAGSVAKPKLTRARSPHLRTLAEGGKHLLKLLSSTNLTADKTNSVVERRRRIRPKHTAICTYRLSAVRWYTTPSSATTHISSMVGTQLLRTENCGNRRRSEYKRRHRLASCLAGVRRTRLCTCVRSMWGRVQLTHLSLNVRMATGLVAVIVKSEDDLRQEQLAMQLIKCAANIFEYDLLLSHAHAHMARTLVLIHRVP